MRCLAVGIVVICAWWNVSLTLGAKVSWRDSFIFQDTVERISGYDAYAVKPWSQRDKQKTWQAIRTARIIAPGVIQRVTAYRPVNLYRSRDPHIDGALGIATPIRNGIYITDRLLDTRTHKRVEDTLIHEWAHLIDVAHLLEIDPQWTETVLLPMNRVRQAVRAQGSHYFDISFYQMSPGYALTQDRKYRQIALNEGMPALYACTNLAESLAVFVERRVKGFQPLPKIEMFLRKHYLGTPFQSDPNMQRIHTAMGLHVDGQKDAAIQAYTELIELSARYRTLTRFRSAIYQDLRQWDAAINDLNLALDVFRVSPKATSDVYKQRARCHMLSRSYDDAIVDITRAIELSGSERGENFMARAEIYQRMGKIEDAIVDLTHVIRIDPESRHAYRKRAYLWRRDNQPDREETDWTTLIETDPEDLYALRERARLRKRQDRTDESIADWTTLLLHQPNDQNALNMRARTYEAVGEFRQAADDYKTLMRINSVAKHRYGTDLARCLVELGEFRNAVQELDAALQLRENYYLPYQEKAWLLATCSDPSIRNGEKALQLAKKACSLTKERQFRSLESLAAAYAELLLFEQAVKWQSKAIELIRDEQAARVAQSRMVLYESGQRAYEAH